MENQIPQSIPSTHLSPQPYVSPTVKRVKFLSYFLLLLLIVAGSVFAGIQIGKKQSLTQKQGTMQTPGAPTNAALDPTFPISQKSQVDQFGSWETYTNNDLKFTIKLPPLWSIKKMDTVDSQLTIWFFKPSSNQTPSSRYNLEITVGSPMVYSTSGGVCVNQWCEHDEPFSVLIQNQTYPVYVTKASRGERKDFERFSFKLDNITGTSLVIRGSFFSEEEKNEIANMLSTLEFNK